MARMVKNLPAMQETWVRSLGREDPWRREWQPTSVLLPSEFQGQRSLVGYSPAGCKESDMTEQLTLLPYLYLSRVSNISIKLVTKQLKIISLLQYITKKDLPLHI